MAVIWERNERAAPVHPTQAEAAKESLAEQIPDEEAQEVVGQVAGQAEEAAGAVTGDEDK